METLSRGVRCVGANEFKSYYVVWKLVCAKIGSEIPLSLNRTM